MLNRKNFFITWFLLISTTIFVYRAAAQALPPTDKCAPPSLGLSPSQGSRFVITSIDHRCPGSGNPCTSPLASQDEITAGVNRWKSRCEGYGSEFPKTDIDTSIDPVADPLPDGELSIEVEFIEGQRTVGGAPRTPGLFTPATRGIIVGPNGESKNVVIGGTIQIWTLDENGNDTRVSDTFAHELGHAYGLRHPAAGDAESCAISRRIMSQRDPSRPRVVRKRDCNQANRRWLTDHPDDISEPIPEVFVPPELPPWGDDIDPCILEPSLPGCATGPGGEPPIWDQCEAIESPGYFEIERTFCFFASGEFWCDASVIALDAPPDSPAGASASGNVHFDRTIWSCPGGGSLSLDKGPSHRSQAGGPSAVFLRPMEGEIVSGMAPIGIALAQPLRGARPIGVFVDGEQVSLSQYVENAEVTGLCDAGMVDPACPYIGVAGMLDTRSFSDGTYEIQVLAMEDGGTFPLLTWATRTFTISNDNPPPPPPPSHPDIVVVREWDSQPVPHGSGYDFGAWSVDDLPQARLFLVCNSGEAALRLSHLFSIASGEGFRVGNEPAGTISPGNCSQLQLRFESVNPGGFAGSATLRSNDPDEPSYTFDLTGVATEGRDTTLPRVFIGAPLTDEVISGSFLARGWALDDSLLTANALSLEIDGQHVVLEGFRYGDPRAGACTANSDLQSPNCPDVGWQGTIDTAQLDNGAHIITLRGVDPSGNVRVRSIPFEVDNQPAGDTVAPHSHIAKPGPDGDTAFGQYVATGWALDADMLSSTSFAFAVDGQPVTLGSFAYGLPEPGACDLHPAVGSPNCPNARWRGYLNTAVFTNGWHTFTMTVTDPSGNVRTQNRSFRVDNRPLSGPAPRLRIELPAHGATLTGNYVFRGWAIDDDFLSTASNIRLELDGWWIDPVVVYGLTRPDVCDVHMDLGSPNCTGVGWTISASTDDLYNGPHILRMIVTDQDGNRRVFDRQFTTSN